MAVAFGAQRECAMSEQVSQTTAPFWTEREQTAHGRAGRVTQNERKKKKRKKEKKKRIRCRGEVGSD